MDFDLTNDQIPREQNITTVVLGAFGLWFFFKVRRNKAHFAFFVMTEMSAIPLALVFAVFGPLPTISSHFGAEPPPTVTVLISFIVLLSLYFIGRFAEAAFINWDGGAQPPLRPYTNPVRVYFHALQNTKREEVLIPLPSLSDEDDQSSEPRPASWRERSIDILQLSNNAIVYD